MIITSENLKRGLKHRPSYWSKDVRNSIYCDIYTTREQGITEAWWDVTVERLSKWKATRGRSKEQIRMRGKKQLNRIRALYEKLMRAEEPCITNLQWSDIQQLFDVALNIKGTKSPVFASKMCHFLFPKLFIVIDNKATGIGHYELFWRGLKNAWNEFEQQEQAEHILLNRIGNEMVHPNYPIETTIMEMCTIGYNNG